jgi:hypothetical protein
MRLVDVELTLEVGEPPPSADAIIASGQAMIARLEDESRASIPAFVPSDFSAVFRALEAIESHQLAAGRRFIEWGSGVGVVTCLASIVGFDAVGIEIEPSLVELARRLAAEFSVDVEFSCGSFVPDDVDPSADLSGDVNWLSTTGPAGYDDLGLDIDDFDVVFAYPWPGEEQVIFDLFTDTAAVGALLLTFHGLEGVRLQRIVRR